MIDPLLISYYPLTIIIIDYSALLSNGGAGWRLLKAQTTNGASDKKSHPLLVVANNTHHVMIT
jgi:hypothetical protein